MKFSCPECQAKYQVDLPPPGEDGVEVKCARCQHTFPVFDEAPSAVATAVGREESKAGETADTGSGDNLDAFLDDLIEQENTQNNPPTDAGSAGAADTSLDGLLDDLLTEDSDDTPPAESSGLDDETLDEIWEDSVQQGKQEETTKTPEDPPEAATAKAAEPESEISPAESQPEETSTTPPADEETVSEDELWNEAFADQAAEESKQTEPEESTAEDKTDTSSGTDDMDNMSEEDAWAAAFADQDATETSQESGEAAPTEDAGGAESEEDLWAKAFEDQAAVEGEQKEESGEPAAKADGDSSEEDLWEQAFDEVEGKEGVAAAGGKEGEEASDDSTIPEPSDEELEKLAALAHEDAGPSLADEAMANYNEEDYADLDEDEFETEAPKKKKGFIPLPSGKTGKLVVGGGIVALLLIAGSAYFAIQTFAPPELVEEGQMAKADGEAESTEETEGENTEATGEAGTEGEPGKEEGASAVEEAQNALLNEPNKEEAVAPAEETPEDSPTTLTNALQPFADIVEMSTIMPVAYSPTDIKVLSFTIHLEMDAPRTADTMREALPVYEKIMVSTVEGFLKRKFYNDILYVKEKLVKRLERAINKGLKQGKVKKAKFKDFQIS